MNATKALQPQNVYQPLGRPPPCYDAPQVVAIDATWSAAKNMVKRLPRHYRRVFIAADSVADDGTAAMPTQSLLRPVRKYRGADGRMCTLEAIVGLLRCVGESAHRCLQHPSPSC